ncbi:chromatin assembly factor 1 subunit A [Zeugodacus cucurbitae]|uniref:chromatin assembly factor 1 subunit A n=1 Tax=Zeugodacus cucurbitae TaxID=28588 RepID=UPI0023D8F059|nr:chromatin assembly factor 1 subunit A [Zeugodacus cucurbitae]
MQSPAVKTPATSKREGGTAKKSSGKKLVQARLPFKIIPAGTPTAAGAISTKETDDTTKDGRKRKLSFEAEDNEKAESTETDELRGRSASKENLTVSSKKLKTADAEDDVIVLDDDDILEEGDGKVEDAEKKVKKEKASNNVKAVKNTPVAIKTPKTIKQAKQKDSDATSSPLTPKPRAAKEKDADTPKSAKSKNAKTPGSAKNTPSTSKAGGSATKLQIKLPLGGAKTNKRRKSMITAHSNETEVVISSDENDDIPVKRQKVECSPKKQKKVDASDKVYSTALDDSSNESEANSKVLVLEIGGNETDLPDSELDSRSSSVTINSKDTTAELSGTIQKSNNKSNISSKPKEVPANTKETQKQEKSVSAVKVDDDELISSESEHGSTEKNRIGKKESSVKENETKVKKSTEPQNEVEKKSPQAGKNKGNDNKKVKKTPTRKIQTPVRATKVNADKKSVETPTTSEKIKVSTNKESPKEESKIADEESAAEVSLVINSTSDSESQTSNNDESKSFAEESTPRLNATPKIVKDDLNTSKKNLTPKQMQLMEQRRKAREEKERRLQEEKLQKQREKEAKELLKKREREEREEQRRKEREEKDEQKRKEREERDEQKRKEREEKEQKRLAELEVKNEEKRKRNEAKEEELRKKEEERKRKEGADLKAKKEAEAFQKFFKAKRAANTEGEAGQQNDDNDPEVLAFRPFEVKGDMKLAPIRRKQLSLTARKQLDSFVATCKDVSPEPSDLYLKELKSGKVLPGIWRRYSVDTKSSEEDVQIIDDELDRAGQAIVEETHAPIEHFRAKFYKFHENRRPPYYGTWRKRTNVIKPRRPFVQDKKFFDYEVDSDLEWEEEEPGESLDGSDDEKEKESEDDDYEVDNEWFVPHGHLSDEELQNEDEVLDANTREAQKAKLQVLQHEFDQEMKKKTEKIKPRLIGCIWADENGNQPALCPKIIWDTLNMRAMLFDAPPLLEDPEVPEKSGELGSPTNNGNEKTVEKVKPIKLTERMLNDLVRLVHGNHHSKNFLIKEFIAYLEANEESIKNGEVRGPIKSIVREKIDDFAEWTITESTKVLQNNKKKNKKRLCWVVSADVLIKMGLEDLDLHNTWKYTLQPRSGKDETTKAEVDVEVPSVETDTKETSETAVCDADNANETASETSMKKLTKNKPATSSQQKIKKVKPKSEITKFTKVLSPKSASGSKTATKATATPETKEVVNTSAVECNQTTKTDTTTSPAATVKKRVPLLMSVARGQSIPQPAKNALISEFLKKSSTEKEATASETNTSTAKAVSEVVEID